MAFAVEIILPNDSGLHPAIDIQAFGLDGGNVYCIQGLSGGYAEYYPPLTAQKMLLKDPKQIMFGLDMLAHVLQQLLKYPQIHDIDAIEVLSLQHIFLVSQNTLSISKSLLLSVNKSCHNF